MNSTGRPVTIGCGASIAQANCTPVTRTNCARGPADCRRTGRRRSSPSGARTGRRSSRRATPSRGATSSAVLVDRAQVDRKMPNANAAPISDRDRVRDRDDDGRVAHEARCYDTTSRREPALRRAVVAGFPQRVPQPPRCTRPPGEATIRHMRTILVATDGSQAATAALDAAIALAAETADEIVAVTVWRALQGDYGLAHPSAAVLDDLLDRGAGARRGCARRRGRTSRGRRGADPDAARHR